MMDEASFTRRMALSTSFLSLSDDFDDGLTIAFLEWLTLENDKYSLSMHFEKCEPETLCKYKIISFRKKVTQLIHNQRLCKASLISVQH